MSPSTNGRNGRGQFAKGNPGGPGNPNPRRTAALRKALLSCVTTDDIRAVVAALITKAKAGDLPAIRELLDRTIGRPRPAPAVELSSNPRESMFTDPATIDFGYQRWLVEQTKRLGKPLYEIVEGPFDPNYTAYCDGLLARGELLPPTTGERVEIVYRDDWFGSAAANMTAQPKLTAPEPSAAST